MQHDRIPVFFVHVVARNNFFILFSQRPGTLWFAFEIDAFKSVHMGKGKNFPHDFKNERLFVKGKTFGYALFLKAVYTEKHDVQSKKMFDDQKDDSQ